MGVNVVDLLMIITIFINKDFLGLMKLKGRLFRSRAEFKSP
jgi:hypothetical protein